MSAYCDECPTPALCTRTSAWKCSKGDMNADRAARIEIIKLLKELRCGDEKPGWTILRALRKMKTNKIKQDDAAKSQMTDDRLIANAKALLELDAAGALSPHGIGGLARQIIEAFIASLEAKRSEKPDMQTTSKVE